MSDKDNTEFVEETEILDEEGLEEQSAGAETLKPNPTRAEMLATFSQLLAQLKGEDLSHFFNDSIKKYSADAVPSATAPGGGPAIGKMPMPTLNAVREDVAEMFSGDDLSEEFKEKAAIIFEAAVNARINIEEARLAEEFETALTEAVEEVKEDITAKADQYLDYVVEQWMEDNKLAIESTVRADIAEDFMEGLYNLFAESYIKVPEEKIDVLGELKAQIEELEARLDTAINEQMELQSVIDQAHMEAAFDQVSEGLAATQVEKLRTLAEGLEFTDDESYMKKLNIIKDKYFTEGKVTKSTGVISEEASEGLDEETRVSIPGEMAHYVSAISRSRK